MSYQWKVLPFGLATAPRVFTALTKSILFHLWCKGFHIFLYLEHILSLFVLSRHARGYDHFFVLYWFTLDFLLIIPGVTFASLRFFFVFGVVLGYFPYVSISTTWQASQHSAVCSFLVVDSTSQVMSFLGKANFVPMATYNCSDCVMSFRVTCWLFIILQPNYFFLCNFPFQLFIN